MTKKRFVQSRHWCIDRVQKRKTEYWDTTIDWLNELNEECGRLNILLNAKDKTIQNLIEMGNEVEKENEELKQENEQYKEKIERTFKVTYNETKLTDTTKKTLQKIAEILDIEL